MGNHKLDGYFSWSILWKGSAVCFCLLGKLRSSPLYGIFLLASVPTNENLIQHSSFCTTFQRSVSSELCFGNEFLESCDQVRQMDATSAISTGKLKLEFSLSFPETLGIGVEKSCACNLIEMLFGLACDWLKS